MSYSDVADATKLEFEKYFALLNEIDKSNVKDCSGIIFNLVTNYNLSAQEIQWAVKALYGEIKYITAKKNLEK